MAKKRQVREPAPEPAARKKHVRFENIAIIVLVIALIGLIGYGIVNIEKFMPRQPAGKGEVVATVNGEPIYAADLAKKLKYYRANFGPTVTSEFVLNQSVNEALLLQEAAKLGITADEEKIRKGIEDWFSQLLEQVGEDQLSERLSTFNLTIEEFRNDTEEMYRKDFILLDLLNRTIFSKIDESQFTPENVTEADARRYFEDNREQFDRVDASHILICYKNATRCGSNRTKEEAEALVEEIYQKLLDGEDFNGLAGNYSDDSYTAEIGGALGEFSKEEMVPEFSEAAFSLKYPNQFSEPVETVYGFHIIKLNSRKTEYEDYRTEISFQLQMQAQQAANEEFQNATRAAVDTYVQSLRSKADIRYYSFSPEAGKGVTAMPGIKTFSEKEGEICTEGGKPIVRLFSTTTCPHCKWVGPTFDSTVQEYVSKGAIVAHHWQLDTGDDALTSFVEGFTPEGETAVYQMFNPGGTIPTFVFGCKYYRIGTGYEQENDLSAERMEFIAVIEELLKD